jgi:hypothetical protein
MVICRMPRLHPVLVFAALCALSALNAEKATAQAVRTASKSADINVFAGWEDAHPDYGPYNSYGGMFGASYTRYIHLPVEPSLEFRANFHSNIAVSEHSYLVGLRAAVPLHFIKPYADFLVGPGDINFPFNVGYTHDNSLVYNYGGGVDVPVIRNFALKLDLQAQHWNTGELTFTPTIGTIGVTYTIPFRPHRSQRDLGR